MVKPLGNVIVCKPILSEETTNSGILLEQHEIPQKGEVIGIGPGAVKEDGTRNKIPMVMGDIVYFPKNQFVEVEHEEGKLYMMNAAAITVLERKRENA